jgi:hypothetical protein
MNLIKTIIAIAAFFAASIAQSSPVTAALDSTYSSRFQDKGAISGAILITSLDASYQSFGLGVKTYAPTLISAHTFQTGLNRTDFTGSYTFDSSLGSLAFGDTLKHYNKPGKNGAGDHNQPFVKLTTKVIPLSLVARYDIATRYANVEANVKTPVKLGSYKLIPSGYAGYGDVSDQFPHSLKAVKQSNRYYGGGLSLSRRVILGDVTIGGFANRSDVSFTGTTFFWSTGYSLRF